MDFLSSNDCNRYLLLESLQVSLIGFLLIYGLTTSIRSSPDIHDVHQVGQPMEFTSFETQLLRTVQLSARKMAKSINGSKRTLRIQMMVSLLIIAYIVLWSPYHIYTILGTKLHYKRYHTTYGFKLRQKF